jgi:hypothetical protein
MRHVKNSGERRGRVSDGLARGGQAGLRHTDRSAESCCRQALTRFTALRCAGPGHRARCQAIAGQDSVEYSASTLGGVRERPNRHDWKSCDLHGSVGSNPTLSARKSPAGGSDRNPLAGGHGLAGASHRRHRAPLGAVTWSFRQVRSGFRGQGYVRPTLSEVVGKVSPAIADGGDQPQGSAGGG